MAAAMCAAPLTLKAPRRPMAAGRWKSGRLDQTFDIRTAFRQGNLTPKSGADVNADRRSPCRSRSIMRRYDATVARPHARSTWQGTGTRLTESFWRSLDRFALRTVCSTMEAWISLPLKC